MRPVLRLALRNNGLNVALNRTLTSSVYNFTHNTNPTQRFAHSANFSTYNKSFFARKPYNYATVKANEAGNLPPVGDTLQLTESNENWEMVYDGLVGGPLQHLKKLSIFSLVMSIISAPVMITFESTNIEFTGRCLIAASTLFLGVGTTALTNVVCSPFATRAFVSTIDPNVIEFTCVNFFGRPETFRMNIYEPTTTDTNRPLSTFQHIETQKHFYLIEDQVNHPVFAPILPHLFVEDAEE